MAEQEASSSLLLMPHLRQIIASTDPARRNEPLDRYCSQASLPDLLSEAHDLDHFRHASENLYERVRALFFLYAIHRFYLPARPDFPATGRIPPDGFEHLLKRRFEEAIASFLNAQRTQGPSDSLSSALASAYHGFAFQTLTDQVRRSVRSARGNQWMFRVGHPADHPLRVRPELLQPSPADGSFPILQERTPVRMDLTHSAWSDIFFLGMDYPEGARVLNVSIDLCLRGDGSAPKPPVEAYLRVIDEPVLRLTSVDLAATVDITDLEDVFNFAKDYLGLLKGAIIASGIVPAGLENCNQSLADILQSLLGPDLGLELVSSVNNIPKGSRLAVSTNLLACLIAACMRATNQTAELTGPLQENERRLAAARAILGEWLGGSGGGWQDSGGVWPGIKLIEGQLAQEGDPEHRISRGRLLPAHRILDDDDAPPAARRKLQESLVLVHGGLAQNVGPILEMVTEKYLLRSTDAWHARQEAIAILNQILDALHQGDIAAIGRLTTHNFFEPLQSIIPWASNHFTEELIARTRRQFGDKFWGFWMLGGMSGGGMGFMFDPAVRQLAQDQLQEIMKELKTRLQHALPFAMDPVVYDFAINETGTTASMLQHHEALMPSGYYALVVPNLIRQDARSLSQLRRAELDKFSAACRRRPDLGGMVELLFDRLFPSSQKEAGRPQRIDDLLEELGFDRAQHEQIRADLLNGRIGLAQNRLPPNTEITDVAQADVVQTRQELTAEDRQRGEQALRSGELAIVTLAAGAGSRWTQGAGVVKALHPFCKLDGKHRSFIETHLAKSRKSNAEFHCALPHIFTTSYLTHEPIQSSLQQHNQFHYQAPLLLSPGRAVGLRMVPTIRDLRFAWKEMPQQVLDEQKQKARENLQAALMNWAGQAGEASDYTDNLPLQCLHPVGHWFEIPNLLLNGTLAQLLDKQPHLRYLLLHNIDTLGANADPALLGRHIHSGACLSFEVINRRIEDRGGGLARVDGRLRLVEGMALPNEEIEFELSYYNSMTTWIDLDQLLSAFHLTRADLGDSRRIAAAIRATARRMPTYITLKDVKKRWGHGQEDVFPVTQFEKLWSDMTALPDIQCQFLVVPRDRGQQLKDQAQLDGWLRDGSAAHVNSLCLWQ